MNDLADELTAAVAAIHDAIDRGDAAALAELFLDPTRLEDARRAMPPRDASPVAARMLGGGWAGYAFLRVEPAAASVGLARFFRRGERWLATSTAMSTPIASTAKPARDRAVEQLFEMASLMSAPPAEPDGGQWPPMPASPTPLDRVVIVSSAPSTVGAGAIDEAERELGCALPADHRDYVLRFGEAVDSLFVRVYPPARIAAELESWRARVDAHWFWAPSPDGFGREAAQRAFPIADTMQGDELVFDPERPGSLYLLPRDAEEVVRLEGGLTEALAWMIETPALTAPSPLRWVQPLRGRRCVTYARPEPGLERAAEVSAALLATDPDARSAPLDESTLVLLPSIGGTALVTGAHAQLEHDPGAAIDRAHAALVALGFERGLERDIG